MSKLMGYQGELRYGLRTGASSGLQYYWKMDDGSGTIVTDTQGNSNGTLSDANQWVYRGKYGGCIGFDGSATYIDTNLASPFAATDDITVSAWVMFHRLATAYIINDYDTVAVQGWLLLYQTGAYGIRVGNLVSGTAYEYTQTGTFTPTLGQWYNVIAIIYGSGRQPRLWVDGVEYTTTQNIGSVTQLSQSAFNLIIGRRSNTADGYWNGLIDEVAIWDRALTEEEVLYVYRNRTDEQFAVPDKIAYLDEWSIDLKADVIDTTIFDEGQTLGHNYEYGTREFSGRCSGGLDLETGMPTPDEELVDDLITGATKGYLELVTVTNNKIMGPVRHSQITLGAQVAGKQQFSMDFTLDGMVTHVTQS